MTSNSIFGNRLFIIAALAASLLAAGCGAGNSAGSGAESGGDGLAGTVVVDGSSTVEPISSAVAEAYNETKPDVEVTVAAHGTGGGFKMFAAGEIDVAGASRPIKEEEIEACKAGGVEWIEIPIAYDGLSILVNPENSAVDDITTDELKKIWEPKSTVKTWADVRAGWPAEVVKLYGPGTDSGTFEYFTEEIVGEKGASRTDYQPSEDDNVLVTGIAGDKFALGYFGYAYYEANKEQLKLLKVNGVLPGPDTVRDGSYKPLSRPLYIYINRKSLDKPAVADFVKFYVEKAGECSAQVGFVPLPDDVAAKAKDHLDKKQVGPSDLLPPRK